MNISKQTAVTTVADDDIFLLEDSSGAIKKITGLHLKDAADGFFFKNQKVAVIGGGNTAVEEALYLSNLCSEVVLVHRRDSLRSEKIMQDKLFEREKNGNITIMWNHTLEEVIGDQSGVTSMRVKHTESGEDTKVDLMGVFIAIGHKNPSLKINASKNVLQNCSIIIASDHKLYNL